MLAKDVLEPLPTLSPDDNHYIQFDKTSSWLYGLCEVNALMGVSTYTSPVMKLKSTLIMMFLIKIKFVNLREIKILFKLFSPSRYITESSF